MKKLNRTNLKIDNEALNKLLDLRHFVENANNRSAISLKKGVFAKYDEVTLFVTNMSGWEIGYEIQDHDLFIRKRIFIKCEQKLDEVPDNEKDPIFVAVMECFLDRGQALPDIEPISEFAVLIEQDVMPLLLTEKNPRLISKGRLIN